MGLKQQYPDGVVSIDGRQFLTKQGAYFVAIADREPGGEWVLRGQPETAAPVTKKQRTVAPKPTADTLADLDT